jgi:hypothetical protein
MESINAKNNCCYWLFSLCCGQTDSAETEPLSESGEYTSARYRAMSIESSKSDGVKTPGTTPTKSHTVREQKMVEVPDYI